MHLPDARCSNRAGASVPSRELIFTSEMPKTWRKPVSPVLL